MAFDSMGYGTVFKICDIIRLASFDYDSRTPLKLAGTVLKFWHYRAFKFKHVAMKGLALNRLMSVLNSES